MRIFRNYFYCPGLLRNAQGIKINLYLLAEHKNVLFWLFFIPYTVNMNFNSRCIKFYIERVIKLGFLNTYGNRTNFSSLFSAVSSSVFLVPSNLHCVLGVKPLLSGK